MLLTHSAEILASPDVVFGLAADVERWPSLHRAYRSCRILERGSNRLVFEMSGLIRGWPARWTAVQEREPSARHLMFRHIKGITTGMRVDWSLHPRRGGTTVTLDHDLIMAWPLVGEMITDLIVGPVFIDWIARQTLTAIKQAAEQK